MEIAERERLLRKHDELRYRLDEIIDELLAAGFWRPRTRKRLILESREIKAKATAIYQQIMASPNQHSPQADH